MEKITITGHLGHDASTQVHNGETLCKFSVAASKRFKKADGTVQERTNWYNCTIWRPNKIAEFLKKGQLVLIEGEPRANAYTDRNGQNRASIEITVNNVELLGKAPEQNPAEPSNTSQEPTTTDALINAAQMPVTDVKEDLPF